MIAIIEPLAPFGAKRPHEVQDEPLGKTSAPTPWATLGDSIGTGEQAVAQARAVEARIETIRGESLIAGLERAFHRADVGGTGALDPFTFSQALTQLGRGGEPAVGGPRRERLFLSPKDLDAVIAQADPSGSGRIQYGRFLEGLKAAGTMPSFLRAKQTRSGLMHASLQWNEEPQGDGHATAEMRRWMQASRRDRHI